MVSHFHFTDFQARTSHTRVVFNVFKQSLQKPLFMQMYDSQRLFFFLYTSSPRQHPLSPIVTKRKVGHKYVLQYVYFEYFSTVDELLHYSEDNTGLNLTQDVAAHLQQA